jgi:hypothetical protein
MSVHTYHPHAPSLELLYKGIKVNDVHVYALIQRSADWTIDATQVAAACEFKEEDVSDGTGQ